MRSGEEQIQIGSDKKQQIRANDGKSQYECGWRDRPRKKACNKGRAMRKRRREKKREIERLGREIDKTKVEKNQLLTVKIHGQKIGEITDLQRFSSAIQQLCYQLHAHIEKNRRFVLIDCTSDIDCRYVHNRTIRIESSLPSKPLLTPVYLHRSLINFTNAVTLILSIA